MEDFLANAINVALKLKLINPQKLTRVFVDCTKQQKAMIPPTDSRFSIPTSMWVESTSG